MDYDKLIDDNGVYLYKDDNFNTISVTLSFLADEGNRENAIYELMCNYILEANSVYQQSEINKKIRELYGINMSFSVPKVGDKRILNCEFFMVSPTVVEDDYSKQAFEYVKNMLLHPDFNRQDLLDMVKRNLISKIKNGLTDPYEKADNLFKSTVLRRPNMEYEETIDIDYIQDMFDSISLEDIKDLYEKTISENNFINGLVVGNITDEEFNSFRKEIPFKSNVDFVEKPGEFNLRKGNILVNDTDTTESCAYITYSVEGLTKEIYEVLYDILNGSSNLCSNILRDKYKLVYESYADFYILSKLIVIYAKIDKDNIDKMIKASDELIKMIKNKKIIKPLLKRAKESIKNNIYIMSEDKDAITNELISYIRKEYEGYNVNDFYNEVDDIKVKDVTKVTKTLKKENVFFYRGDYNEKL